MKRLVLTRHAKTHQALSGESDFDRKLTDRGFSDIALIAKQLLKHDYLPQAIVASPANRARQTAVEFSKLLKVDAILFEDDLYGHYTIRQLSHLLDREMNRYDSIMVVGHNPTMAILADMLSGSFTSHLPTTGVVLLDSALESWSLLGSNTATLIDFIYPRLYK